MTKQTIIKELKALGKTPLIEEDQKNVYITWSVDKVMCQIRINETITWCLISGLCYGAIPQFSELSDSDQKKIYEISKDIDQYIDNKFISIQEIIQKADEYNSKFTLILN
jgi:hypothetical protein